MNTLDGREQLPEYVKAKLAKGPTHPILNRFDETATAVEANALIERHQGLGMSQDVIIETNIASYRYIQVGKEKRTDRPSINTAKYFKREKLVSIPYDKGKGFCSRKEGTYKAKLEDITNGPQFEKITETRKWGKHIISKEEERVNKIIKF